MKVYYRAAVSATVTKAFETAAAAQAIDSTEYLRIQRIFWNNKTANAGGNLLFDNEDNDDDFWRISLDIAGGSGFVDFGPRGLELPQGEDVDITLSGGTTDCYVYMEGEKRKATQ